MSMAWMRMPGQTWPAAAVMFLGMWVVMMVAMMTPSLVPMLSRYRRNVRRPKEAPLGRLTAIAGAGYFFVWTLFGAAAYPVGVAMAAAAMSWPVVAPWVPAATGLVVLVAGLFQLSKWKVRQLWCCRESEECCLRLAPDAETAWRHGLHLGRHCALCCSGLMAILLVTGVMDLVPMAVVAAAITTERLTPRPERAARIIGALAVVVGAVSIVLALRGSRAA